MTHSLFPEAAGPAPRPDVSKDAPLAERQRPRSLDEIVGQGHLVGPDKVLRLMVERDQLASIILWGPPGTGKTTLARIIARETRSPFVAYSAVLSGIKEIKGVMAEAEQHFHATGGRTVVFVDEIHRFNKAQQDAFLPYVESGVVVLIGATTENPYFEINSALLSRMTVFMLNPLSADDIRHLLVRTLTDRTDGLGNFGISADDDALDFLSKASNGDARRALGALELAALTNERGPDGKVVLDLKSAGECIRQNTLKYDKDGDNHYDTISAFIKSMRGSDPDAAVYYLARMLRAGESVTFIARRILICASEDVGNADPQALCVAASAALAVERVGMPESQIILTQAASYIALAPKSNSALGIYKANEELEHSGNLPIPAHLRDAHYQGAAQFGHGLGYLYPHDFPGHHVEQQYLPDAIKDRKFYDKM